MWNVWKKKSAYAAVLSEVNKFGRRDNLISNYVKKQGYGLDMTDKWRQYVLASCIENQVVMNSVMAQKNIEVWDQLSLSMINTIWRESIIPDIVSVQPMSGPCDKIYSRRRYTYECEEVAAKTRKLKTYPSEAAQDLKSTVDDMAELLGIEVRCEIDREVVADIRNNSDTLVTAAEFKEGVERAHAALSSKLKHYYGEPISPNWMVTGPDAFKDYSTPSGMGIVNTNFNYHGMNVFLDTLFPANQAVIGYKGNEFESPYIYSPYVMLTETLVVLDPDGFCPRRGLLTRYSKKLMRFGGKGFAKVSWGHKNETNSDNK